MELVLLTGGNMLDRVTVTLSRREVALMNLCLGVVAHHTKGGNLRSDIESLQTRLTQYHAAPSTSRKKQAGCGSDCRCQEKEHIQRIA